MSGVQRVLCYARVSGADQERGTSLDGQRARFASWCASHDYPLPLLFVEVESAGEERREKRVELDRLLAEARDGDLVAVLVVDRWTRDVVDGVASVRKLLRAGVGWVAIEEDIDARTDHGYEQLLQRAAGAEMERRRIRKRTVGARQRLRALGYHVEGQPPPGYRLEGGRGLWKLAVEPLGADLVRRMFALCIEGKSTRAIAVELGGARGLDGPAIGRRLRDRRYLGESCSVGGKGKRQGVDGVWTPTHEPLVDRGTFDLAAAALTSRLEGGRRPGADSRVAAFLLRGWGRCAICGHVLRCQAPMPGSSTRHAGWYCCARGCAPHARQDAVDVELERLVLARLEELRVYLSGPPPVARPAPDLSAARARAARRLVRLIDAVADGTIPRETARIKIAAVESEIADLDRRRVAAEPQAAPARGDKLATVEGLRVAWGGLSVEQRRQAAQMLAERVEVGRAEGAPKWSRAAWRIAVTWRPA